MHHPFRRPLLLLALLAAGGASATGPASAAAPKRVLVVTVTTEFRHSSISQAEQTLAEIAARCGDFTVDFVRQPPGCPKFLFAPKPDPEGTQSSNSQARQKKYEEERIVCDDAFAQWLPSAEAALQVPSPADLKIYDRALVPSAATVGTATSSP